MMRNLPSFMVYRSSAGSGKTFVLAREYLITILQKPELFSKILAITFTNKAAGEMKERILKHLMVFAQVDQYDEESQKMAESVMDNTAMSSEELYAASKKALQLILHNYSDFNIGTIDSFVHRIIRNFALELKLSYSFEVTLDTDDYIELVLDNLFSSLGENRSLTKVMKDFTKSLLEDEKSWRIEHSLADYIKFLTSEESIEPLNKLVETNVDFDKLQKENATKLAFIEKRLKELCYEADQEIKSFGLPIDYFSHKSTGIYTFFRKVADDCTFEKLADPRAAVRIHGYLTEGKQFWPKAKTPEEYHPGFMALQSKLMDLFNNKIVPEIEKHFNEYTLRKLLRQIIYRIVLSKEIKIAMEQVNLEENIVPIYEFNRLIWGITGSQDMPFIYERTGEYFENFLIDEFQDTSALQWHNLLPLIVESLAKGGYNLVVGDAKQAIYRFRNGDIEQFVMLPEVKGASENPILKLREKSLSDYYQPEMLEHNYRSATAIVNFNNDFFDWLKLQFQDIIGDVYNGHQQKVIRDPEDGYVEIELFENEKEDTTADIHKKHLEHTLQKIKSCIDDGYPLKDICILTRKKSLASEVATMLIKNKIRVVSDESLLLKNNPEFQFIRSFLGILLNRGDKVNAATIITWLYAKSTIDKGRYADALYALGKVEKGELTNYIKDLLTEVFPGFDYTVYLNLPLYELCEQIIYDFKLESDNVLASRYFLELAESFAGKNTPDLTYFIKWLDEKMQRDTIPLSGSDEAVTIMTIHKAKGLQFPVVIYPFAWESDKPKGPFTQYVWANNPHPEDYEGLPCFYLPLTKSLQYTQFSHLLEKEDRLKLLDMVNLNYVAFTRPKNRLYIISSNPSGKNSSGNSLFDLLWKYKMEKFPKEGDTLRFGKTVKKPENGKEEKPASGFGIRNNSRWWDKIEIKSRGRKDITEEKVSALSHGLFMHRILGDIYHKDMVDEVVKRYRKEGWITAEDEISITQKLKKLLDVEEVSRFFEKGVTIKNETEIIATDGSLYRPDRIVFDDKSTDVVEFKTGEPYTSHEKQVKNYISMLNEMGYQNLKGHIIYIDTNRVVEIPA